MIRYIPCSSLEVAQMLSAHLWSLEQPAHLRQDTTTAYLFGRQQDASGQWWLEVVTDYAIRVHAEAVLDGIADILAGAGLDVAAVSELESLVLAKRGQVITPWEFFPLVFKDAALPSEQINWPARA